MLHNSRKHADVAFTLIELLVVMTIITILAALLFPSFATAREKARQTACVNNLRQLGIAVLTYEEDYDERVPNATHGKIGNGVTGGWVFYLSFIGGAPGSVTVFDATKGALYSYVKSGQIYVCPDDNLALQTGNLSYAMNSCLLGKDTTLGIGLAPGDALSQFASPTGIALFCEEAINGDAYSTTDDGFLYLSANNITNRHSSGSNFVFVDGHAKWYNGSNVLVTNATLFNGGDLTENCSPY